MTQIVILHAHRYGVGRRAAARNWASKSISDYPGGLLHVDFAERPIRHAFEIGDVLAECLLTLGTPPGVIPVALEERANLYRARTADKRAVVILEGVTDPIQVRALTPVAPGSVVIVTSCAPLRNLAVDGAQQITVWPMSQDAGLELLRAGGGAERLDAEPDAAAQLVDWCGGLPIALNVVASVLRNQPGMTIAALVDELVEEHRRRHDVPPDEDPWLFAVFSIACAKLPEQAATLYGRLGAAPIRTMTASTAACISRTDSTNAERLLEILRAAHLIEAMPSGRFRLHDAIRPHAHAHAAAHAPSAVNEVLLDLIQHYVERAVLADRTIRHDRTYCWQAARHAGVLGEPVHGRDGAAESLAWFASERAALLAVARAALVLRRYDQVWRLVTRMTWLYLHFGYADDWLEALDLGIHATSEENNWLLAWLIRVNADLKRPDLDPRLYGYGPRRGLQ